MASNWATSACRSWVWRIKSASKVSEAFLKSLWLRGLPEDIRKIVSASEISDFSHLAEALDSAYEARELAVGGG